MDTTQRLGADEQRVVYPNIKKESEEQEEKERRNRRIKRKALVVLIWTLVVLIIAFLILFISSKVGRFESIPDMLHFIQLHFHYSELFKP